MGLPITVLKQTVRWCFLPARLSWQQKAGAKYVSPFIGRIDDKAVGWYQNSSHKLRISILYKAFETEILAASIRNPNHIIKCAELGADVCTCPPIQSWDY